MFYGPFSRLNSGRAVCQPQCDQVLPHSAQALQGSPFQLLLEALYYVPFCSLVTREKEVSKVKTGPSISASGQIGRIFNVRDHKIANFKQLLKRM